MGEPLLKIRPTPLMYQRLRILPDVRQVPRKLPQEPHVEAVLVLQAAPRVHGSLGPEVQRCCTVGPYNRLRGYAFP